MTPNYTIPIIDLSQETLRQTVVDRENGIYLGHPTTVLLEDGRTILTVYPKNHGVGSIVYKRSEDGGLHWSDRLPVPESWATSLEVPTLYRTVGPDGRKHLLVFSGLRPIRMAHSEDDGATWTELEPIGDMGGIVAMGDLEPLGGGRYLAMFHDDGRFMNLRPGDETEITKVYVTGEGTDIRSKIMHRYKQPDGSWGQEEPHWANNELRGDEKWVLKHEMTSRRGEGNFFLYGTISEDGGLTWGDPFVIAHHEDANLCEPCIIRSPDGGQLTVLLRENSRRHNSYRVTSDDNGKTWGEPVELPAALTGDRHASVYLPDGRLFISFRDTARETPTQGDWCGWVGTYEDILAGREGQYRVRLMDNLNGWDCAYPGVLCLPDGTVVTTTYGHWVKDEKPFIVSVRFHPAETDRMFREGRNLLKTEPQN